MKNTRLFCAVFASLIATMSSTANAVSVDAGGSGQIASALASYTDNPPSGSTFASGGDSNSNTYGGITISSSANLATGELKAYADVEAYLGGVCCAIGNATASASFNDTIRFDYGQTPTADWTITIDNALSFGSGGFLGNGEATYRGGIRVWASDTTNDFSNQIFTDGWTQTYDISNFSSAQTSFGFTITIPAEYQYAIMAIDNFSLNASAGADESGQTTAPHGRADVSSTGTSLITVPTGVIAISDSDVFPVSTVPLPPALWLLSSGLLGLIGISRKRK